MRTVLLTLLLFAAGPAPAQDLVVKGGVVYPVDGPSIEDGVVVVRDGKIAAVGAADEVRIPEGVRVLEAAVVTPGFVDAHTVVGLAGALNQPNDQDQLERSDAIQPDLRAIDAYNARELLVEWVRSLGVTTINTGHAPGEVVSGQTMIAKTRGDTVEEAVLRPVAMVAATLGEQALASGSGRKSPGTRAKAVAMLRQELIKAGEYRAKRDNAKKGKEPPRDLRLEALASVLDGDIPLLVTANRHQDISTALRIAEEFDIPIVLDGAAEAYLLTDEIRAAGVPGVIHPMMARAYGDRENISFTTPRVLLDAGIPVAFQSGFENYVPKTRVLPWEAAISLAHGVEFDEALAAITLVPARILGLEERIGSITKGKDADLALFDGDPFEYTSHVTGVVIDGEVVSEVVR
ncbi:MAG: amidohydrolase family protein [Gammaproteobacteria bacterium]